MTVLFGGDACPLGLDVQFVQAPLESVVAVLSDIWVPMNCTNTRVALPRAMDFLLPFEAPWTRMLVASAGAWTAVVNNFVNGGDSTAPGPAVSRRLGVRCVVAEHAPRYGPGHAATQMFVLGPEGEPPLGYIRTLSAHATDGRWRWYESGTRFAFEETERYSARLKRDRFDRAMLLRYLRALGIPVEDEAYGVATLLQQVVSWPRREETLAQAKAVFGL